ILSRIFPHLGSDQPIYGFQPRWTEGHRDYTSVEEAATEVLAELRRVPSTGRYLLAGHCVGGVIAMEMARQLVMENEEVGLLGLIDTQRPSRIGGFLAGAQFAWRKALHMASVVFDIARGKEGSRSSAA